MRNHGLIQYIKISFQRLAPALSLVCLLSLGLSALACGGMNNKNRKSSATNSSGSNNNTGGGSATAQVAVSPTTKSYLDTTSGTSSAAQTFTLSNTGTADATNVYATVSSSDYLLLSNTCGTSGAKVTVAASTSCSVQVTFKPGATGASSGTLTITYDDGTSTGLTLTASLSGLGLAPGCSTITHVQTDTDWTWEPGTKRVATVTQTAGNLLVAVVYGDGLYSSGDASVTDTLGNTWHALPFRTKANAPGDFGAFLQVFFAESIPAGSNTITMNGPPGGRVHGYGLMEYAGVAPGSAVDVTSGSLGTVSSTLTPGSMTLSSNCSELVVGSYVHRSATLTPGGGYNVRVDNNQFDAIVQDNIGALAAGNATVNPSTTANQTDDIWLATQVSFRAQGSADPSTVTKLAVTSAPQTLTETWKCSGALTIQAQDSANQPVSAHPPITLNLSGTDLVYYEDADCKKPLSSALLHPGTSTRTLYFEGGKTGTLAVAASATSLTSASQNQTILDLADHTWIGGGGCDGAFSTAACWKGGAPNATEPAHFDANCSTNCVITLPSGTTTVRGLNLHPTFTGTLDLAGNNLALDNGSDLIASGGTLTLNGGTIDVTGGGVYISGGTQNLSGTLASLGDFVVTGGTQNTSGSTIALNDPSCTTGHPWLINGGSTVYDAFEFVDNAGCGGHDRHIVGTLNVGGTLTVGSTNNVSYMSDGEINATGDVVISDLGFKGSTVISIAGSGNQTLDATSVTDGLVPSLKFASTGGTITVKGTPTVNSNFEYVSGAVDFTSNNATLQFNDDECHGGRERTIKPGTLVYGNVAFIDQSGCAGITRVFETGSTMRVGGLLTLGGRNNTGWMEEGTLEVRAGLTVQDLGYKGGTTVVKIAGGNSQTIDSSATAGKDTFIPNLELASTGGTVTVKGTPTVFGDFTYTSGTYDFTTHNATLQFNDDECFGSRTHEVNPGNLVYGNVAFLDTAGCMGAVRLLATGSTMKVGGTLTLAATNNDSWIDEGTLEVLGGLTVKDLGYWGSTMVTIGGSNSQIVDQTANATAKIPNLTMASTGGTVTVKGTPTVAGHFIHSSGTIDYTSFNSTLQFNEPYCGMNRIYDLVPGTANYDNVSFMDDVGCGWITRNLPAAATMTITGNLALGGPNGIGYINDGTLAVRGDVLIDQNGNEGTVAIAFTGTGTTTLDVANPTSMIPEGAFSILKTGGGSVTLLNNVDLTRVAGQNFNVISGSLLLNDYTLQVSGDVTVAAGATISQGSSCSSFSGPLACECSSGCGTGTPSAGFANNNLGCGGSLFNNGTVSCP